MEVSYDSLVTEESRSYVESNKLSVLGGREAGTNATARNDGQYQANKRAIRLHEVPNNTYPATYISRSYLMLSVRSSYKPGTT